MKVNTHTLSHSSKSRLSDSLFEQPDWSRTKAPRLTSPLQTCCSLSQRNLDGGLVPCGVLDEKLSKNVGLWNHVVRCYARDSQGIGDRNELHPF